MAPGLLYMAPGLRDFLGMAPGLIPKAGSGQTNPTEQNVNK